MPEAIAIFFVGFVAGGIFLFGRLQNRRPQDPQRLQAELSQRKAWLQQRLHQAEHERWSHDMRERLREQLTHTERQLAALQMD